MYLIPDQQHNIYIILVISRIVTVQKKTKIAVISKTHIFYTASVIVVLLCLLRALCHQVHLIGLCCISHICRLLPTVIMFFHHRCPLCWRQQLAAAETASVLAAHFGVLNRRPWSCSFHVLFNRSFIFRFYIYIALWVDYSDEAVMPAMVFSAAKRGALMEDELQCGTLCQCEVVINQL